MSQMWIDKLEALIEPSLLRGLTNREKNMFLFLSNYKVFRLKKYYKKKK